MNPVLEKMLRTNLADGENPDLPLHSHMDQQEGRLIDHVFRTVLPDVSLEIGCAFGVSTLYVCDALSANGKPATHIVIDPFQHAQWRGIGIKNVFAAGYGHFVDFRQQKSEFALPMLAAAGTRVQAAIIDGNHKFDHALVDFFYVNRMLDVGGIVILDDADFPAITRLAKHVATYPAYEIFAVAESLAPIARRMLAKLRRVSLVSAPGWRPGICTSMAFRKIADDDRRWDWHADF
jgi:predicted O-methyltransferase YrrM